MPSLQELTSRPATAPELADLLDRVERLRRISLQRLPETPTAPWIKALGGREIVPGLVVAERRFPLWYRHEGRELACITRPGPANDLCAGPLAERIGFLSLLPASLDDGSSRLLLATWGRLEEQQFVIRQGLAGRPGAEAALLTWLAGEMGKVEAVAGAGGRGNQARLTAARLRHGLDGTALPAFVEAARPAPANHLAWRSLQSIPAARLADLYRRQRDSLLSLATAACRP